MSSENGSVSILKRTCGDNETKPYTTDRDNISHWYLEPWSKQPVLRLALCMARPQQRPTHSLTCAPMDILSADVFRIRALTNFIEGPASMTYIEFPLKLKFDR
jgi:hypothetical protein